MVKIAITADLHFKGDKLTDSSSAWSQLIDYCIINKIPNLFILGDIFDNSNIATHRVSVGTITKAFLEPLLKYASFLETAFPNQGTIYVLEGNHDQAGASQDSSLQFLNGIRDNIHLIDKSTVIETNNIKIGLFPWISQRHVTNSNFSEGIKEIVYQLLNSFKAARVNYLMGHIRVDGYDVSGYKMVGGHYSINLSELLEVTPNLYFGDIHKSDDYYVGSLIQNNFGDAGNFQGFIVLDTDNNTKTRIPVISAEYKILKVPTLDQLPKELPGKDYYRLDVSSDIDISAFPELLKNSNVKIKTVSQNDKNEKLESLDITNLDEVSLFKEWLQTTEYSVEEKERVLRKVEVLKSEIN